MLSLLMFLVLVFFSQSVAIFRGGVSLSENQTSLLHSQLQKYCPYSSFCTFNAKKHFKRKLGNMNPCCQSCSCDSMCGLNRNCCFHDDDVYNMPQRDEIECTSAYVRNPSVLFYYMVNKCFDKTDSCMDSQLNPWGALNPVYSPATRLIYINEHCAFCNNVSDGMPWRQSFSIFIDKFRLANEFSVSDMIKDILKGKTNCCSIWFIPPNDVDLTHLRCNIEIGRPTFNVTDEMEKLCSGFNSTFILQTKYGTRIWFGNVFCALINFPERDVLESTFCDSVADPVRLGSGFTFTGILTGKLDKSTNIAENDTSSEKSVCRESAESSEITVCKPLLCPEGQIYVDGKCTFMYASWANSYIIVVKLTPVNKRQLVPISLLQKLTRQELDAGRWLLRGELTSWWPSIFYHPSKSSTFVEYFVVRLMSPQRKVELSVILKKVKAALGENWKVSLENNIFEMFANMDRHLDYYHYINISFSPFAFRTRQNDDVVMRHIDELVILLTSRNVLDYHGLYLSRSYFCEQVDLYPSEYLYEPGQLYFNSNNTVLGQAEFRRISTFSGKGIVRVCAKAWLDRTDGSTRLISCVEQLAVFSALQLSYIYYL